MRTNKGNIPTTTSMIAFLAVVLLGCGDSSSESSNSRISDSQQTSEETVNGSSTGNGSCELERASQYSAVDLSNMDCSGKDLSGVYLQGVRISGSNFSEANLTGARFTDVEARDVDFTNANMRGFQVLNSGNSYFEGSVFDGADMSQASFGNRSFLDSTSFKNAKLVGFEMVYSSATDADFTGSDLSNAHIQDMILDGVNFSQTQLRGINFGSNLMTGGSFEGAIGFTENRWGGIANSNSICNAIGPDGSPYNLNC